MNSGVYRDAPLHKRTTRNVREVTGGSKTLLQKEDKAPPPPAASVNDALAVLVWAADHGAKRGRAAAINIEYAVFLGDFRADQGAA